MKISENALTAVSLIFPLQNIVSAVAIGFGVGLNSCIARSLDENDKKAVGEAATHSSVLTIIHSLIFILVGIFITYPFLSMFIDNAEILTDGYQMFNANDDMIIIGATALRIISIGFIISSISVILSGTFEALGDGKSSLIISLIRQFIIIIPSSLILSRFLGVTGVWILFPISEIIATIVSIILFKKYKKMYLY